MFIYILCIPLIIIIIIYELSRKKYNKYFDVLTFVNLIFVVLYCIIPIISIFNIDTLPFWTKHIDLSSIYGLFSVIFIYVFYFSLLLGYYMYNKKPLFTNVYIINTDTFRIINIFHFSVSLILLFVFIASIGGFNSFLTTNTLYRSGNIEVSSGAFLRNLVLFIPIASHIIFAKILTVKKNTILYYFYSLSLLVTFILSILIYFNRASRLSTIFYILLFLIIYMLIKKKINVSLLLITGMVFVFYLLYGKSLFNYFLVGDISFENNDSVTEIILNEFSFPFLNTIIAAQDNFLGEAYRFYIDILLGILNTLPSSLIPIEIPDHDVILNSEKYLNLTGVPIDIVGFNYYSLGIAGLILGGIVFGYIINMLENLLRDKTNIYTVIAYAYTISFITLRIPYTSPTNSIKSNFNFLIFLVCLILLNKVYNRYKNDNNNY